MNKWIFALILGVVWLTSCSTPKANASFTRPIYELDPIYRNLYSSMGGERMLGGVISVPFMIGEKKAQFVEKALLIFDPKGDAANTIQLESIGNQLGITEKPVDPPKNLTEGWLYINGHVIPKEFADVFLKIGGIEMVGNPITEVHFNQDFRRYEQYFEKVGLYRLKSDPIEAVYTLGYGEWLCGELCIQGNDQNDEVDIILTQEKLFQDFILKVGSEFSGYVIEENLVDGYYESLLKNMLIKVEPGNPDQVKILPLSEIVGVQPDTPYKQMDLPNMVFVPVDDQRRGFHVPKIIYEYIQSHGGLEVSGKPINKMGPYGTIYRQCFTNMCILIDPNSVYEQVFPEALGFTHQRVFHRQEISVKETIDSVKSADNSYLILPDGEIRVREKFPSLPLDQVQVIHIEKRVKDGQTFQEMDGRLILQPPGQVEIIKKFTLPSEGHIELTLPAIVVENATLIPYKVCVFSKGKELCLESEFVIWNSP